MSEHSLEARLQMVARALDADAPAFDPAVLRAARRHPRRTVIMLAVAALAVATAAPAAISALRDLFDVELVPELTEAPNAVGPYLGPPVPFEVAKTSVAFRVRTIPALGTPDSYHMRPDIKGGMVTVAYGGSRILLSQWQAADVGTRISVVPAGGTADEVSIGGLSALWIAGTARGLFSVIGADGAVHKELFDVADGALLWEDAGVAFLLQGAGTKDEAARLAADVAP